MTPTRCQACVVLTLMSSTQSTGELEMADDFEDLTQSSDTATEELETPVSGYRNASLLFKQLDSSYLGESVNSSQLKANS